MDGQQFRENQKSEIMMELSAEQVILAPCIQYSKQRTFSFRRKGMKNY